MVPPDENLDTGESSDTLQIENGLSKLESPGAVTGDKDNVLWPDGTPPPFKESLLMVLPTGTKDVHGFSLGGKVKIADGEDIHRQKPVGLDMSVSLRILSESRGQENRDPVQRRLSFKGLTFSCDIWRSTLHRERRV